MDRLASAEARDLADGLEPAVAGGENDDLALGVAGDVDDHVAGAGGPRRVGRRRHPQVAVVLVEGELFSSQPSTRPDISGGGPDQRCRSGGCRCRRRARRPGRGAQSALDGVHVGDDGSGVGGVQAVGGPSDRSTVTTVTVPRPVRRRTWTSSHPTSAPGRGPSSSPRPASRAAGRPRRRSPPTGRARGPHDQRATSTIRRDVLAVEGDRVDSTRSSPRCRPGRRRWRPQVGRHGSACRSPGSRSVGNGSTTVPVEPTSRTRSPPAASRRPGRPGSSIESTSSAPGVGSGAAVRDRQGASPSVFTTSASTPATWTFVRRSRCRRRPGASAAVSAARGAVGHLGVHLGTAPVGWSEAVRGPTGAGRPASRAGRRSRRRARCG